MDPVSQGAVGAIAAGGLSGFTKSGVRLAILVGWGAGMLADADIFIRSESDPLLNIEYHRHFTHSLIFIPVGGLLCAAMWWILFLGKKKFAPLALFSIAGYATAGLLDACTSYGTQLLWPFSNARVAWHIISIVDPIFTLTILIMIGVSLKTRAAIWAQIACVFAVTYLQFGVIQYHRASSLQKEMIAERGLEDAATMLNVKPSIGNLILWRSVYRHDDQFHSDAIRLSFFGENKIIPGGSIPALDLASLKKDVPPESALSHDLDRFAHFSAHYLARHPDFPDVVGDFRYAMIPNSITPLWGIRYNLKKPEQHASFESFRDVMEDSRSDFFKMLFDTGTRSDEATGSVR